jgi:uncharacterized membrane protein
MRIVSAGQVVFAATMIALGILGLIKGDFTPVWSPVPGWLPARELLVYLCALISLACGIGLVLKPTSALAARVLFVWILLWWLVLRVPLLFLKPAVQDSWSGAAETAVMVAAAGVFYASFVNGQLAAGGKGVRSARILYGLAMIPFGEAHFAYLKQTADLVPAWLPSHVAWACFTGGAFLAAGIAILIGVCARLAATLSVVQLGLFVLLVWVPIAAHSKDAFVWSETILSAALTAGAWVVADSYRNLPWLAVNQR